MKALIIIGFVLTALVFTTGCEFIQNTGSTETTGTPVTAPPDFTVDDGNPTTPPPASGGDNNTQNGGQETPVDPGDIEEGFLINGGASRTAGNDLQLQMITLARNQMKITTDIRCEGGSWEPWSEFKTIAVPARDAMNTVTVQFRDWDGRTSHCYRQAITHDGKGPDILFTKYPMASVEEGSSAQIIADVADVSGVKSVVCRMNNVEKACLAGTNSISISQLAAGDYTFSILAEDNLGNRSEASVSWTVVSLTRRLTQGIRVNNYKMVDILIVIDNSGSMEYEQKSMAKRTGTMLSVLRGLDYQIAITTTDQRGNAVGGDGQFLKINGTSNDYLIKSTTDEATAQARLSSTLQRPETGDSAEQGIRSAYRVVERYVANEAKARAFFREGAQFAVLVISDEDESANTAKNDPENLVSLVGGTFGGQKMFGYHSIITKPGDTQCRATDGFAYGERYATISRLTGGVIGSVCAADYTSQVTGIAQGIRDLLKTLTLQCQPLPEKGLTVKRAGVVLNAAYRIDGVNLKFDNELEPGDYSVEYSCLK